MTNPSAAVGPGMSSDEEDAHQEQIRATRLDELDAAIQAREATIKDLQESLKAEKAERKRIKDGGRV